jgi:hypothetical protein
MLASASLVEHVVLAEPLSQSEVDSWTIPSPDGKWRVRAGSTGKESKKRMEIWVEDDAGKKVRQLSTDATPFRASWSSDGAKVVFGEDGSVYVAEAPAFKPKLVMKAWVSKGNREGSFGFRKFWISPDGGNVLAVGYPEGTPAYVLITTLGRRIERWLGYCPDPEDKGLYDGTRFVFNQAGGLDMACGSFEAEEVNIEDTPLTLESCTRLTIEGIRRRPLVNWVEENMGGGRIVKTFLLDDTVISHVVDASNGEHTIEYNEVSQKIKQSDGFRTGIVGNTFRDSVDEVVLPVEGTRCLDLASKASEGASAPPASSPPPQVSSTRRRFERPISLARPSTTPVPRGEVAESQDIEVQEADDGVRMLEGQNPPDPEALARAWCALAAVSRKLPFHGTAANACTSWQVAEKAWKLGEVEMEKASNVVVRYLILVNPTKAEKAQVCSDFEWAFESYKKTYRYEEIVNHCSTMLRGNSDPTD